MLKKFKKYQIIISLLLVTVAFAGLAEESENQLTDLTRPILVGPSNPEVSLNLPANPTTGYQLVLSGYDHELLEPVSSQFFPPAKDLIGAPGYTNWKFKMKKIAFIVPQQTTVILKYVRPWEMEEHQQIIRIITKTE